MKKPLILALVYLAAVPIGLAIGYFHRRQPDVLRTEAPPSVAPSAADDAADGAWGDVAPGEDLIELNGSVTVTVTGEDGETRTLTLENVTIRPARLP